MEKFCEWCGWNRNSEKNDEIKLMRQGFNQCSTCGYKHFNMEDFFKREFKESYFNIEDEVRCVIMNALFKSEVTLWDNRPEIYHELIYVDNIPMQIAVGDIPFFWKGRYYVIEIKFMKLRCEKIGSSPFYYTKRSSGKQLTLPQIKLLLAGGGILLIVAEPLPSELDKDTIKNTNQEKCEFAIKEKIKNRLGSNELPYQIAILNQERFLKFWREHLSPFKLSETDVGIKYKNISISKLIEIVPESYYEFSKNEIISGEIVKVILGVTGKEIQTDVKL